MNEVELVTGLPAAFPYSWAEDWGEDDTGIWVAFSIAGIRQAMRWIPPGTFMMGSAIDEPERLDDESQHHVTLSQGFWMGETAVTQALWRAVMDTNPSHFKGDELPIEQVSWNETQNFLTRLNQLVPGLELRLPSEAEWEYACRAGTQTPFYFGKNITTEQVNYDGNFPYNDGPKGEYRRQTLASEQLPANAWGLYQMHGNVHEWCNDIYGPYTGTTVDPQGVEVGKYRALRGGSWLFDAAKARSAARRWVGPDNGDRSYGFRLALGQVMQHRILQNGGQGLVVDASEPHLDDVNRLLEQWDSGDPDAGQQVISFFYPELKKHAIFYHKHFGSYDSAEDLLQEVVLYLLNFKRSRLNFSVFHSYIRVVMKNISLRERFKRRDRDKEFSLDGKNTDDDLFLDPDLFYDPKFNGLFSDPRKNQEIRDALKYLRKNDPLISRIIELRFFEGMSHKEISDALGINMHSVKRGSVLAMNWLREHLKKGPAFPIE